MMNTKFGERAGADPAAAAGAIEARERAAVT